MQFDLATAVPLVVSVLGVLGIGSVIGQWIGASKDRRAARAAVLKELAAVEEARWGGHDDNSVEGSRLRAAIRQLETAALLARVPRSVIIPYAQLATAALWSGQAGEEKYGDPGIDTEMAEIVLDAATLVSKAAWSIPGTRWWWLWWKVRQLNHKVAAVTDPDNKRHIRNGRGQVR